MKARIMKRKENKQKLITKISRLLIIRKGHKTNSINKAISEVTEVKLLMSMMLHFEYHDSRRYRLPESSHDRFPKQDFPANWGEFLIKYI